MILVKKTPLGEIRRNKRLVIFIDDLQDYVLSPRRDSDSKALIGDSCTTTFNQALAYKQQVDKEQKFIIENRD